MHRNSLSRQVALVVAGASLLLGVILGFWPVSVTVVGDVSYSCGSGFMHSRSTWKADTGVMGEPQQVIGLSNATPNAACPSRVYRHRDLAYALVALAIVMYAALLATAAFDPGATPVAARRRREVSVLRR
jgi:hypothetical protein